MDKKVTLDLKNGSIGGNVIISDTNEYLDFGDKTINNYNDNSKMLIENLNKLLRILEYQNNKENDKQKIKEAIVAVQKNDIPCMKKAIEMLSGFTKNLITEIFPKVIVELLFKN